jgi:hypothetical protein
MQAASPKPVRRVSMVLIPEPYTLPKRMEPQVRAPFNNVSPPKRDMKAPLAATTVRAIHAWLPILRGKKETGKLQLRERKCIGLNIVY